MGLCPVDPGRKDPRLVGATSRDDLGVERLSMPKWKPPVVTRLFCSKQEVERVVNTEELVSLEEAVGNDAPFFVTL